MDKQNKQPEKRIKTSVAFPEPLWKDARKRAIDEDCDLQDIVVRALREYLQRKGGAK
jgi:hypothetical protein